VTRTRVFLLVWAAAAVYALAHLDHGWFAADAGALGQAAQRVLHRELPHRDFVDVYTGGLAFLDALAFRVLGEGVMTMRWVAFAVFLAWLPAVWYIAARVAGPGLAALGTLLAAAWTLPVYAEGMPSWYNLFLATFGVAALLRHLDRPRPVWLFVAGLCGGLSILFKVVGLYFVAAGLLFLVRVEATRGHTVTGAVGGPGAAPGTSHGPARDRGYRAMALAGCLVLAGAVAVLVARGMGARFFFLYAAPPLAAVGAFLPWAMERRPEGTGARLGAYLRLVSPFLAGVALPVALFLVPYVASGSVGALWAGVFQLPQRRLDSVRMIGPAGAWTFALPAAFLVALLVRPPSLRSGIGRAVAASVGIVLVCAVVLGSADAVYTWVFRTLLWLPPLVCLAMAVAVVRHGTRAPPELALLLAAFGLVSLVQVPFAAPAYFFYAAPLMVLLVVVAVGRDGRRLPWLGGLLVATLAFTVLWLNVGFSPDLGFRYRPAATSSPLVLQRAMGIRVSPEDKADYEAVVRLVGELDPGPTLYAAPDCPEVYFLTGLRNPTPSLFEVLDDPAGRDERVLDAIQGAGVRVLVIRPAPLFSPPLDADLLAELARRYPMSRQIGRFIVAWRGEPTAEDPPQG